MPVAELKSSSEQTRARLLVAARTVFSQQGFQGATVREICRRAGANVAAVNYHFGGKNELFAEALNFSPLRTLQQQNACADADPEVRLSLFIESFMRLLLDESHASSQCQIMARELADPTPALDQIVREAIAPLHEYLHSLLHEVTARRCTDERVTLCVNSIVGQCMYYRHAHPVLLRLNPELRYDAAEIAAIAQHIAAFSLRGLAALK
ncbi:MAG: hypothetical protein RL358_1720 [Pseudomonadota bacterium]|jgi:AcrR family transcriptional regulator